MDLTNDQQRLVGMIDARLEGRWNDAYRIASEELVRDPTDGWQRYQLIVSAVLANRPLAAVGAYNGIEWDPLTPGQPRFGAIENICDALHMLGRYDEEFTLVRDALAAGPLHSVGRPPQSVQLRPLAALGRIDEINRVVDEILLIPESGTFDWNLMISVANELRVHGFPEAGQAMAERAVAWFENNPEVPKRVYYSMCLMNAGRVDAAWTIIENLLPEFPDHQFFLTTAGVCAAQLGDRAKAIEFEELIVELGEADLQTDGFLGYHGVVPYRRARIAAQLGEHDRAISLLQQAVTDGFSNYLLIHRDPNFEPLWDDPEFQEILRPKG